MKHVANDCDMSEKAFASAAGPPVNGSPLWAASRRALACRLLLKPLVSSTENSAVPIEAAICWVMFISVEPRAISWSFRVASAEDMIGIIVPPMPSPITNSEPSSRR